MPTLKSDIECPCCSNPWAAATGDLFAKICGDCEAQNTGNAKKDFEVDESISPATDFYLYANKKWMEANPIPKGYPSWNTFLHLHSLSQERLKDLLQVLNISGVQDADDDTKKLAYFYKAAMDEEKIENDGTKPIQLLLEACKNASVVATGKDKHELATVLGEFVHNYGVSAFFSIGASPDNTNSDHSICQIAQGGLGLPDKDYYFDDDKDDKRMAYKKHIAKMLTLLQDPHAEEASDESITYANQIFELEIEIAEAHMTKTENRDPEATYNKMSIEDFISNVL